MNNTEVDYTNHPDVLRARRTAMARATKAGKGYNSVCVARKDAERRAIAKLMLAA